MIALYRPGASLMHRAPAGPKLAVLIALLVGISFLPRELWLPPVLALLVLLAYLVPAGLPLAELGRQLLTARWLIIVMLLGQVIFLGPESAYINTARVLAMVLLAALVTLTTRSTDMLDALVRGMGPLRRIGVDPDRVGLVLLLAITTIPVIAAFAAGIREAHRARGARLGAVSASVGILIASLRHADELGDALAARGVE